MRSVTRTLDKHRVGKRTRTWMHFNYASTIELCHALQENWMESFELKMTFGIILGRILNEMQKICLGIFALKENLKCVFPSISSIFFFISHRFYPFYNEFAFVTHSLHFSSKKRRRCKEWNFLCIMKHRLWKKSHITRECIESDIKGKEKSFNHALA